MKLRDYRNEYADVNREDIYDRCDNYDNADEVSDDISVDDSHDSNRTQHTQ